jgi:tetratricopeptide (TPR) repeat protein
LWGRGLKWARRRPAAAALAVILPLAVLNLLGLGGWSYLKINDALDKAEMEGANARWALARESQQRTEAENQKKEALKQKAQAIRQRDKKARFFQIARYAVNRFYSEVDQNVLLRQPHLEGLRQHLLRLGINYFENLVREESNDPDTQAERARAYMRYAQLTGNLGKKAEALGLYRQGLTLFERLALDHPRVPDHRHELAIAHTEFGDVHFDTNQADQARAEYGIAIKILKGLTREYPARDDYWNSLASAQHNLGILYLNTGKPTDSEKAFGQARAIREKLVAPKDKGAKYERDLAMTLTELANLYLTGWRLDEAEKACRRAVGFSRKLARNAKDPAAAVDLARGQVCLGNVCYRKKQFPKAEAAHGEALNIFTRLSRNFPAITEYKKGVATCQTNLGAVYDDWGRKVKAEQSLRQAIVTWSELAVAHGNVVPEFPLNLAFSCGNFAIHLRSKGKARAAIEWHNRAVVILFQQYRPGQGSWSGVVQDGLRKAYWQRAETRNQLGEYPAALRDWDRALKYAPEVFRHPVRVQRALTLAHLGDHRRATEEAKQLGRPTKLTPDVYYNLACVYSLCVPHALKEEQRAQDVREKQAEQYAARAVALLHQAYAAGLFHKPGEWENFKKDNDLAPLRARADFKELVKRLEKKGETQHN